MAISDNFSAFIDVALVRGLYRQSLQYMRNPDFNYGHSFNKFLSVNLVGGQIEVPVYLFSTIQSIGDYTEIAVPLVPLPSNINKPSTSSYLNYINNIGNNSMTRLCATKLRDVVYYSLPGIIMDENYNILIMITAELTNEVNGFTVTRINCRLSPQVFTSKNNLEKNILKYIVPVCDGYRTVRYYNYNVQHRDGIRIIVEDMSKWIYSAEAPDYSVDNTEKYVNIISKHLGGSLV